MPHPPSAKKRHRQSLRRAVRNRARRTEARSAVRRARELIAAGGEPEDATATVRQAGAVLDRAARKGVLHPNNASRRKSRLMHGLNAMSAGGAAATPKRRARSTAKPAAAPARTTRKKS